MRFTPLLTPIRAAASPWRRGAVAAAATALVLGSGLVAMTNPAAAAAGCRVDYTVRSDWGSGFTADVSITNLGDPVSGWTLGFSFPGNQQLAGGWSATWAQSGNAVTARSLDWNANLATGGATSIGFNGAYSGANPAPSDFTLNGVACTGQPPSPTPTDPTPTPTDPSPTPTTSPTPTPTSTEPPPPPGEHVENPYAGAKGYVNPDWAAEVNQQAYDTGGTLGQKMAQVANYSTAVWMDRIGAITEGRGLRGHLDAALQQQTDGTPVAIQVVIYNLPNRDCAALASNGELRISENGLQRYKTEYIDPIAEILSDPAYRSLRIVTVIEVDSLPNLVTNLNVPDCAEANSSGAYVNGIRYAVDNLNPISNVYTYLDIAHSGWLGWPDNFDRAVRLYADTIRGMNRGFNSIDGFITNSANYTPTEEPFLTDSNKTVGGQPVKASAFYEWNPYLDELDFAQALRQSFVSQGMPPGTGMLIDTSRNGWGGPNRPTSESSSTSLNTYVDESRADRRPHRGGWCNQAGAGIGERPRANPAPGIDGYVWVKPPGESDGVSEDGITDPNDPNKRFDPMCDPNARNRYNNNYPTNALPDAPHAGRWFPAQFRMLVENAYPAV